MQNTIIKEFADDDRVFVAVYNEAGSHGETRAWTETVWSRFYLRGSVIFDATGSNSQDYYNQPSTGLPFGRVFIIDQSGNIVKPMFGYAPASVIATIHELLGD